MAIFVTSLEFVPRGAPPAISTPCGPSLGPWPGKGPLGSSFDA